jgi:hypothetical protein
VTCPDKVLTISLNQKNFALEKFRNENKQKLINIDSYLLPGHCENRTARNCGWKKFK